MSKHTITVKEIQEKIKNGVSTFSKKDNSPRGCSTVSASEIKIGDEIVIDNYFTTVVDDALQETEFETKIRLLRDTIARLQSENEVLQNDNDNLISSLQDYETENANLNSENAKLHDRIAQYLEEIEEIDIANTKLIGENEYLQNKITSLEEQREGFLHCLVNCSDALKAITAEKEELQTQLHQYQALFADIEQNMTVSLYESLLGTKAN